MDDLAAGPHQLAPRASLGAHLPEGVANAHHSRNAPDSDERGGDGHAEVKALQGGLLSCPPQGVPLRGGQGAHVGEPEREAHRAMDRGTPDPSEPHAHQAIALFTPEAIPAWDCSAPASTAAVSGATVIASPSANTSTPGSTSEP